MSEESTFATTPPRGADTDTTLKPPEPRSHWWADLEASLVVFLVALPLSLGIAVASGAPVVAGIIAAVIGGIVCGLLGGAPLQVTGPAAGLTAVVAGLVAEHGWRVTCLITAMAGIVQIGFGLTRVARAALAISPAVVHGMLAGIGMTIVVGQLHVLLGADSPSSALTSMIELPGQILDLHADSALLGLGTIALTLAWPRVTARLGPLRAVPAPLASVTLLTAVSLPFAVERVDLPGNLLAAVRLPELPEQGWLSIGVGVLTVALVASVETLLSAVAVDKMHNGPRADLDRELVGQGSANILSGLAGGLPVTGVIVRSATNVRAGAKTRWSAILHAVWVAVFSVLLVSVVRQIPLSVLAGLLVVIGVGLVNLGHLRKAHRHGEGAVWVLTLAGVLVLNLLEGVVLGIVVALVLTARRAIRARIDVIAPQPHDSDENSPWWVVLAGTVTFVSLPRMARRLSSVPVGATVRLDIEVDYLDQAASEHLLDWVEEHRLGGGAVEVREHGAPVLSDLVGGGKGPRARVLGSGLPTAMMPWTHGRLDLTGASADATTLEVSDADGPQRSGRSERPASTSPLLSGVGGFHGRLAPRVREVLHGLRDQQSPCTLFITCADSRVVPNLITSSGPGDLFTVRNVGNLVPVRSAPGDSTLAALEYAVGVLRVSTIAVCGHSGCGAMRALLQPSDAAADDGALSGWLANAEDSLATFRSRQIHLPGAQVEAADVSGLAQVNVTTQLGHLMAHPMVRERVEAGHLELVGMFFDIGAAEVHVLEDESGEFSLPVGV